MDLFTKNCVIKNFSKKGESINKAISNTRFPDFRNLNPKKIRKTTIGKKEIYTYDE